jgi:hypothetical protein
VDGAKATVGDDGIVAPEADETAKSRSKTRVARPEHAIQVAKSPPKASDANDELHFDGLFRPSLAIGRISAYVKACIHASSLEPEARLRGQLYVLS